METNKAVNITPVDVTPVTNPTLPAQGKGIPQQPEENKVQIQLGNVEVLQIKMMERMIQQNDILIKQNDTIINILKPKQ